MAAHEFMPLLQQVEQKLASEYQRLRNRSTEDPGTSGDGGEENWAGVLRDWLPDGYHVRTKGRIQGPDQEASPQVDVVVLKPSYPKALLDVKYYASAGVAAAFECKTTLTKAHLTEAANTAAEIQRISDPGERRGKRTGTPFRELYGPIFYGVLAHSHSWSLATAADHVTEEFAAGVGRSAHPRQALDLVCVADLGTWITGKWSYQGPEQSGLWSASHCKDEHPNGYASCIPYAPPNWQEGEEHTANVPFAQLCAHLTQRLAWEDASLRDMADYYALANFGGTGAGHQVGWSADEVYSPEVLARLRGFGPDRLEWSEWGLLF